MSIEKTTATKADIRKVSLEDLKLAMTEMGDKPFRAKQVYEWIWKKSAHRFSEMTNLSKELREKLEERYAIYHIETATSQHSKDGTVKSGFKLWDKHVIEGVLIPVDDRMTACVSSQVGCALTCKFCATGYMKRMRNLDAAEIYDQVVAITRQAEELYQKPLSNIVYMGMGEPLLNYDNVWESIEKITSPEGLGMSPRRITVSTAGISKKIMQLADDGAKFNLAVSLHAANDAKRHEIMPINKSNNLDVLRDALKYYFAKTKNMVTYEYIVFHDFNDTLHDAEELYQFTKHLPCKVNIIEYNPISEADFVNTAEDKLSRFQEYLERKKVNVTLRRSRGKDVDAACGQLANKN